MEFIADFVLLEMVAAFVAYLIHKFFRPQNTTILYFSHTKQANPIKPMTYQDIVNRTAGVKYRTEVKIENGTFALNGVEFCVNFRLTCPDNDGYGGAVYITSADAETDDGGCASITIEFPYVSDWENLDDEEREALIAFGEQCDWTRAYIVSGI